MKIASFILLSMLLPNSLLAQSKRSNTVEQQNINTNLGSIAVYQRIVPNTIPVIFLHGVYYDHNLWNYYTSRLTDRTVITIDMPHHGKSKNISKKNWEMDDCANMLIEILDSLGYRQAFAIGHSWGSMTILRAATKAPERFQAIGLCNMPFDKGSFGKQLIFGFQHLVLPFRKFYTKQVAKVMFSNENLKAKPEIAEYLAVSMSLLTNREIRQTDKAVITKVEGGNKYLNNLRTPALTLMGNQDYVGTPENIEMTIVEGAHTSPLEQAEKVLNFIKSTIDL